MNSTEFIEAVDVVLRPPLESCGYRISTKLSGRSYDVECAASDHVAVLSFEPGDGFLLVAVLPIVDGKRGNLDDRETSPRLADLNRRLLDGSDIEKLRRLRNADDSGDAETARLVEAMHQLTLVLPKYAAELRATRTSGSGTRPRIG